MKITDPRELLDLIDKAEFRELCQLWTDKLKPVEYVEPNLRTISVESENAGTETKSQSEVLETVQQYNIKGKAILFGDNIDTDAVTILTSYQGFAIILIPSRSSQPSLSSKTQKKNLQSTASSTSGPTS